MRCVLRASGMQVSIPSLTALDGQGQG